MITSDTISVFTVSQDVNGHIQSLKLAPAKRQMRVNCWLRRVKLSGTSVTLADSINTRDGNREPVPAKYRLLVV